MEPGAESDGAVEGSGAAYNITRYVAGPGNHTLSLGGYDIRDRAGNHLADVDPAVNEPYHIVGPAARTCQRSELGAPLKGQGRPKPSTRLQMERVDGVNERI